jgi:uncharacterized cupredoxin-like copper-binding protein
MRLRIVLSIVAACGFAVSVVACGGGGSGTTGGSETTSTEPNAATTIRIVVKDGKVVGGLQHQTVAKDDTVTLVVTSDVADEVHLHGYDKSVDVAPGMPARLTFVASLPGRFEVELEDRALQIADLEVSQ